MKKILFLMFVLLVLIFSVMVGAHEHNSGEIELLIQSRISCDNLSDAQLEGIGDYYMEQMHPGAAHERMDEMMGGEGSVSLRQMHISMARSFYCGDSDAMSSGMMDMMMERDGMSGGMMGGMMCPGMAGRGSSGMMGSGIYGSGGFLFSLLYVVLYSAVFAFIFWLTYNWLAKDKSSKKRR